MARQEWLGRSERITLRGVARAGEPQSLTFPDLRRLMELVGLGRRGGMSGHLGRK